MAEAEAEMGCQLKAKTLQK